MTGPDAGISSVKILISKLSVGYWLAETSTSYDEEANFPTTNSAFLYEIGDQLAGLITAHCGANNGTALGTWYNNQAESYRIFQCSYNT